jgi:hypothetical protein
MRVDLLVPYNERHDAKRFGAKWDGVKRTWYIVDVENIERFMRWMPAHLKRPHNSVGTKSVK